MRYFKQVSLEPQIVIVILLSGNLFLKTTTYLEKVSKECDIQKWEIKRMVAYCCQIVQPEKRRVQNIIILGTSVVLFQMRTVTSHDERI
jgi:hypothetical protein